MRALLYFLGAVMLFPAGLKAQVAAVHATVAHPLAVADSRNQFPFRYKETSEAENLVAFNINRRGVFDRESSRNCPEANGSEGLYLWAKITSVRWSERLNCSPEPRSSLLDSQFDQSDGLNQGLMQFSSRGMLTLFRSNVWNSCAIQVNGYQLVAGNQALLTVGPLSDSSEIALNLETLGTTIGVQAHPPKVEGKGGPAFVRGTGIGGRDRISGSRKIIPIILSLANHAAVTWDAQTTNQVFHHYPEGFKPVELDPIMRPFAGKAAMYPMANLLLAGPVDFLLYRTRRSSKSVRLLSYAAAGIWVALEVHQSVVNMQKGELVPVSSFTR
jgi:hypothetical protein